MQVYMRKGRLLLSLQAVKHALKLAGAAHPDVHRLIVRLCQAVQQQQQQASNDQVKRVMQHFVLHQISKIEWTAQYNSWLLLEFDTERCSLSKTKRTIWGFAGLSCSLFAQCSPEGLRQLATFGSTAEPM